MPPYDLDRDLGQCEFRKLSTVRIPVDTAYSQLTSHLLWLSISKERITWRKIHDKLRKENSQELSDQISEYFAGKIMVSILLPQGLIAGGGGEGGGGGGLGV